MRQQGARPDAAATITVPAEFASPPEIPQDVLQRFPSMREWQAKHTEWWMDHQVKLKEITEAIEKLSSNQNL